MTKKANHQVNVVRISQIEKHTNADTLEIIRIGEYQVVAKIGQFHVGDLAIYIQPDSVVPQTEPFRFIWEPYFDPLKVPATLDKDELVPERHRRITVRKFRKEWSEGLLMSITDFTTNDLIIDQYGNTHQFLPKEGDDISDLLGITHYDPDTEQDGHGPSEDLNAPRRKKRYPKSLRGWVSFILAKFRIRRRQQEQFESNILGIPIYDVDSYKAKPATFSIGEDVEITEKIHGSNARYVYLDGKIYAGSRNKWKAQDSICNFRRVLKEQPWIEQWCRAHEGYVLWGELTPTQKGYHYGSDKLQFFVFDIYKPDSTWADKEYESDLWEGINMLVPIFYKGPYKGYDHVKTFVDGPSKVTNAKNIREGIVVVSTNQRHERGGSRAQRKIVSNSFLEKDNK